MRPTINQQMAHGAGWMTLFTLTSRLQGLVSMIILARLLVPEDFGVVAMATSLIAGAELLTALGLHVVLIQHPDPKAHHFNTAFTLNFFLAFLAAALVVATASPIATFYGEPRVLPVVYLLAFSVVARGLENVHTVWFQKDLEFRKDFFLRFVPRLAGFFVTIPLAFYLRSYWALVAGMLFTSLFTVIYSYIVLPVFPRFSLAGAKSMLNFSKWLFMSNILGYGVVRGIDIVIGRVLGSSSLGTYSISYEIATLPSTQLAAPINRAVFPGYSKLAADLPLLRNGYLDVTGMIAVIAVPASIGIAAVADLMVPVVLGDSWLQAIPVIELLAWFGAVNCLFTNIGPLFNAVARPYYMTYLQVVSIVILIPAAIFLSSTMGIIGAGWAILATALITMPLTLIAVKRILDFRLVSLLGAIWRPIFASLTMYFVVRSYIDWSSDTSLANLLISVLAGIVVYIAALLVVWVGTGRPVGSESAIANQIIQWRRAGRSPETGNPT